MHIDQARTLKAALERGIEKAEEQRSSEVELNLEMDAELGRAITEAEAVLKAAKSADV